MSGDITKRGYKIVTITQLSFSLIALFVSSFIWNNGDIYIQLGYNGYGWQTLITVCLCCICAVNLISAISQLSGTNVFQEYGKVKLLVIYGFCALMAVVAAILETWNSKLASNAENSILHPRFVITAVFCWLLIASHAAMILIVSFT